MDDADSSLSRSAAATPTFIAAEVEAVSDGGSGSGFA
jgi:hypothetical protein